MASDKFELGLVLAGAVSAGAYTAGVLDFFFEALDAWEDAHAASPVTVPPMQIKLRVIAGSSAGGLCAAIVAAQSERKHVPATSNTPIQELRRHAFYAPWVRAIGIDRLLDTRDLPHATAPVQSLLDSSSFSTIGKNTLEGRVVYGPGEGNATGDLPSRARSWISDRLHLYVTQTNLSGVPYTDPWLTGPGHRMTTHGDYMHFLMQRGEPVPLSDTEEKLSADAMLLPPLDGSIVNSPWESLLDAGLASSAFPGAFAPRRMDRRRGDYERRPWNIPVADKTACSRLETLPPDDVWGRAAGMPSYYAMDGGIINNEPFELARKCLSGSERNPRGLDKAHRAVLMVDPFPAEYKESIAPASLPLVGALRGLISALLQHVRFKPEELALAANRQIGSRYFIAPSGSSDDRPLASGALKAFAGFLSQEFREHDFQLGRRNCQRFLKRWFILPETNKIFDAWKGGETEAGAPWLDAYAVEIEDPDERQRYDFEEQRLLQVIPLFGSAANEVPPPSWPTGEDIDFRELERKVGHRLNTVVRNQLAATRPGWITRGLVRTVWFWKRRALLRGLVNYMRTEIT